MSFLCLDRRWISGMHKQAWLRCSLHVAYLWFGDPRTLGAGCISRSRPCGPPSLNRGGRNKVLRKVRLHTDRPFHQDLMSTGIALP